MVDRNLENALRHFVDGGRGGWNEQRSDLKLERHTNWD